LALQIGAIRSSVKMLQASVATDLGTRKKGWGAVSN